MLLDSGAEILILDTAFARKVGCVIDENQKHECVGIGENTYMTEGRTKINITLMDRWCTILIMGGSSSRSRGDPGHEFHGNRRYSAGYSGWDDGIAE